MLHLVVDVPYTNTSTMKNFRLIHDVTVFQPDFLSVMFFFFSVKKKIARLCPFCIYFFCEIISTISIMESVSPENTLTAVNQASETIVTKGLVDCNFPDLRNTFNGKDMV